MSGIGAKQGSSHDRTGQVHRDRLIFRRHQCHRMPRPANLSRTTTVEQSGIEDRRPYWLPAGLCSCAIGGISVSMPEVVRSKKRGVQLSRATVCMVTQRTIRMSIAPEHISSRPGVRCAVATLGCNVIGRTRFLIKSKLTNAFASPFLS